MQIDDDGTIRIVEPNGNEKVFGSLSEAANQLTTAQEGAPSFSLGEKEGFPLPEDAKQALEGAKGEFDAVTKLERLQKLGLDLGKVKSPEDVQKEMSLFVPSGTVCVAVRRDSERSCFTISGYRLFGSGNRCATTEGR
jgi:hypothetical protein